MDEDVENNTTGVRSRNYLDRTSTSHDVTLSPPDAPITRREGASRGRCGGDTRKTSSSSSTTPRSHPRASSSDPSSPTASNELIHPSQSAFLISESSPEQSPDSSALLPTRPSQSIGPVVHFTPSSSTPPSHAYPPKQIPSRTVHPQPSRFPTCPPSRSFLNGVYTSAILLSSSPPSHAIHTTHSHLCSSTIVLPPIPSLFPPPSSSLPPSSFA
jgi:hypothetical protein